MNMDEQELAREMMETRDARASISRLFKKNRKQYIIRSVLIMALIAYSGNMTNERGASAFLMLLAGMLIGSILRDFGWFRSIRKAFPFTLKVTDWDKVEEIARKQ